MGNCCATLPSPGRPPEDSEPSVAAAPAAEISTTFDNPMHKRPKPAASAEPTALPSTAVDREIVVTPSLLSRPAAPPTSSQLDSPPVAVELAIGRLPHPQQLLEQQKSATAPLPPPLLVVLLPSSKRSETTNESTLLPRAVESQLQQVPYSGSATSDFDDDDDDEFSLDSHVVVPLRLLHPEASSTLPIPFVHPAPFQALLEGDSSFQHRPPGSLSRGEPTLVAAMDDNLQFELPPPVPEMAEVGGIPHTPTLTNAAANPPPSYIVATIEAAAGTDAAVIPAQPPTPPMTPPRFRLPGMNASSLDAFAGLNRAGSLSPVVILRNNASPVAPSAGAAAAAATPRKPLPEGLTVEEEEEEEDDSTADCSICMGEMSKLVRARSKPPPKKTPTTPPSSSPRKGGEVEISISHVKQQGGAAPRPSPRHPPVCVPCLREHAVHLLTSEQASATVPCICGEALAYATLAALLRSKRQREWALYERRCAVAALARSPAFHWCANPACDGGGQDVESGERFLVCRLCDERTCLAHERPAFPRLWNERDRAMEEGPECCSGVREDGIRTEGDFSKESGFVMDNTKACPKCGILVFKTGGCRHMTCRVCRHEWWWCCGRKYRDEAESRTHRRTCGLG